MLTPQEARRAVRDHQEPAAGRATRSSSSATSSTRCSRSPTGSPCCAAASRSRRCPREGATEDGLARADGRPRGAAPGRQAAGARRRRRCSRSRACSVRDDRGLDVVRDVSLDGARAARSSASPASTATARRELIDAITGLRRVASGRVLVGGEAITHASARRMLDVGRRPHPRGPAAPRARARLLDRREHRAARLRPAAGRRASAGSSRSAWSSARAS